MTLEEITVRIETIDNGLIVRIFTSGPGSTPTKSVYASDAAAIAAIIANYIKENVK